MTDRYRSRNAEQLEAARKMADQLGEPEPRTRADVERLTGVAYYGPDPEAIGKTQYPKVQRPS